MVFFKWVHFFIIFHFFASTTPLFSDAISSTKFLDLAKKPEVFDWMIQIRRKIHEYPELLYEEFKTNEVIRGELDKLGIPYESPVAVTGVIGYIGTQKAPFVAIRADMDGLPIEEMVEWEHKSKVPGKMHACGHDAHVAMLLGAAKILKEYEKEIQGTVVLVFQPAEEGGAGAKRIIAETKFFKDISAIFGLHVAHMLPIGEVASRSGPLMAGSGMFQAIINGRGGHGAMPHEAIDPVVAASSVVARLQTLVSREADPLDSQVVSVTILQGGDALNVIPDSVRIGGTFRALRQESLESLKLRIEEVIIAQAAVDRCNATVDFDTETPLYPATVNPSGLHEHFLNVAEGMIGSNKVHETPPVMASEDFAFYQQVIPGYFFFLGIQDAFPVHSPFFTINEGAFPYGAALHASLATSYIRKLHNPGAVEGKHHDEF